MNLLSPLDVPSCCLKAYYDSNNSKLVCGSLLAAKSFENKGDEKEFRGFKTSQESCDSVRIELFENLEDSDVVSYR